MVTDLQGHGGEQGSLEGSWVGRRPIRGWVDKGVDAYLVLSVVLPFRTKELHASPIKIKRHVRLCGVGDHETTLRVSGVFISESSERDGGKGGSDKVMSRFQRFRNSLVRIFIQRRRSGHPITPINSRVDDHRRSVLDSGG